MSIVREEKCQHCGDVRITYARCLPKSDLRALFSLYHNEKEWVHIKELTGKSGGGDFAKYRYWGLITSSLNDDPKKKDNGFWKITERGEKFLLSNLSIPAKALVCRGECIGHQGDFIDIYQALAKSNFNYTELMEYEVSDL